jgi:cytochrome b
MNPLLNYFIEANICLLFFLATYFIWLKNETQFKLKRGYLICALVFALVYPMIDLQEESVNRFIPSVRHAVPAYWLPEIIINNSPDTNPKPTGNQLISSFWTSITFIYLGGLILFLGAFLIQLIRLLHFILN